MGLRRRPTDAESGAAPPEQGRPRLPLPPAPPAGRSLLQTAGDAASAIVSAGALAAGAALVQTASSFVAAARRPASPYHGVSAVMVGVDTAWSARTRGDQQFVVVGYSIAAVGAAVIVAHIVPDRPLEVLAEAGEMVRRGVARVLNGQPKEDPPLKLKQE
ncbi:MAG: hypothetical protein JF606_23690 [Burkholderiales bacterium]|nr:hypothetical protein [Burkholderiales bacterium]